MEEPTDFPDWEVLHGSTAGFPSTTASAATSTADPLEGGGIESDSDGGPIKSDYFALDSNERYSRRRSSSSDEDGLLAADSDNPGWVEPPNSDSRYVAEPSVGEIGSAGIRYPRADPSGLWTSGESSNGRDSPPRLSDLDEHGGAGSCEGSELEASGLEGVEGTGGVNESVEAGLEGIGGTDEVEEGKENSDELVSGDAASEALEERSDAEKVSVVKVEKVITVWWKLPVDILNFCVLRVRPVWSISIAAAVVGFLMLGRRLYRMKRNTRSLPIKVTMDGKKASQLAVGAARLNEVFSVAKRVQIIKSSLPAAAGVTPWPVMVLR